MGENKIFTYTMFAYDIFKRICCVILCVAYDVNLEVESFEKANLIPAIARQLKANNNKSKALKSINNKKILVFHNNKSIGKFFLNTYLFL